MRRTITLEVVDGVATYKPDAVDVPKSGIAMESGFPFVIIDSISSFTVDEYMRLAGKLDAISDEQFNSRLHREEPPKIEVDEKFVPCKNHHWRRTKSRKLVCGVCGTERRR